MGPGQMFAVLAQRHMHLYGTKREHFAEVAISTRANARRRETSIMRTPLTLDDYFNARMIAEPLCLFDFCLECDGAVAVVTTSAERAKDLRHPPVYVHGVRARRARAVGPGDHLDGHARRRVRVVGAPAGRGAAVGDGGLRPADVDVALLYDHFSPMVDPAARGLRLLRDRRGRPVRGRRQHPLADRHRSRSTPTAATCRRRTSSA